MSRYMYVHGYWIRNSNFHSIIEQIFIDATCNIHNVNFRLQLLYYILYVITEYIKHYFHTLYLGWISRNFQISDFSQFTLYMNLANIVIFDIKIIAIFMTNFKNHISGEFVKFRKFIQASIFVILPSISHLWHENQNFEIVTLFLNFDYIWKGSFRWWLFSLIFLKTYIGSGKIRESTLM